MLVRAWGEVVCLPSSLFPSSLFGLSLSPFFVPTLTPFSVLWSSSCVGCCGVLLCVLSCSGRHCERCSRICCVIP